jgi:hypothetical protein
VPPDRRRGVEEGVQAAEVPGFLIRFEPGDRQLVEAGGQGPPRVEEDVLEEPDEAAADGVPLGVTRAVDDAPATRWASVKTSTSRDQCR